MALLALLMIHNAFVLVVAHLIKTRIESHETYRDSCRLIMPYKESDTKPSGADNGAVIDTSIIYYNIKSAIKAQLHPSYTNILAIYVAKKKLTVKNTRDTFVQLSGD
ncbi:hypothetical protein GGI26_005249 [Coemansia sp. RSA 1358]|uniref:Uncharacterized protein n=1 Tax=Coemansia umbellata TaxID=1424467 RepID=A0ABQ8PJB0_9FUNG|nr:hypothetical protein EDC05_004836 [Coemansia umbellata]KAJ2620134.1 hypothetical protein GGI26_005249 [Coemansia sp. RSA 1358]